MDRGREGRPSQDRRRRPRQARQPPQTDRRGETGRPRPQQPSTATAAERRFPRSVCFVPSTQKLRRSALPGQQGNGLLVEGHECFAAQPGPLVGDHAIGKIAAGIEDGKA